MVLRVVWFLVAASALSYVSYLFVGGIVNARASGAYEPIVVRDVRSEDAHHLSGMITVPSPCDQLSVHAHALSTSTFMLTFNTWREPSVDCKNIETPRAFHTILFAPYTGVQLGATLDGAGLPIVVLPVEVLRLGSTSTIQTYK